MTQNKHQKHVNQVKRRFLKKNPCELSTKLEYDSAT